MLRRAVRFLSYSSGDLGSKTMMAVSPSSLASLSSASSAPPARYFDAAARRWILVELRHGVYKRFPFPDSLLVLKQQQHERRDEEEEEEGKIRLGDLVLCRVASMYQTGIVHGASTLGDRFLLPFSFCSSESAAAKKKKQIPTVSAEAFPRTGGEIVSVLRSASLSSSAPSHQAVAAAKVPLCRDVSDKSGGLRPFLLPGDDETRPAVSSSSSNLDSLEKDLLAICQRELLEFDIRSVRAVSAVTDLARHRSFVQIFYVESDASTPLDAFKEHLARVYTEFFSKAAGSGSGSSASERSHHDVPLVRVWMSNCDNNSTESNAARPHGLSHSTVWPQHMAWPTPLRHRLSSVSSSPIFYTLQHLLRCVLTYPTEFAAGAALSKSMAKIAFSLAASAVDSQQQQQQRHHLGIAVLCSLCCGEWEAALQAIMKQQQQRHHDQRDAEVSKQRRQLHIPLRDRVALLVAANSPLVPESAAAAGAVVRQQVDSLIFDASTTPQDDRDLLNFVRDVCCEYTSIDARKCEDDDDMNSFDDEVSESRSASATPAVAVLPSALVSAVRQNALVSRSSRHGSSGGGGALSSLSNDSGDSLVVNYHSVAKQVGLWKTRDPRADFNTVATALLTDDSLTKAERSALTKTINSPYVAKYMAPRDTATASLAKLSASEKAAELRKSLEQISEQRHLIFRHALAHHCRQQQQKQQKQQQQQQVSTSNKQSPSTSSSSLRPLQDLRRFYMDNFHRSELSLADNSLLTWAELCMARSAQHGWLAALEALMPAMRKELCAASKNSNSSTNLKKISSFVDSTLADKPQLEKLRTGLAALVTRKIEEEQRRKLAEDEDSSDGTMPSLLLDAGSDDGDSASAASVTTTNQQPRRGTDDDDDETDDEFERALNVGHSSSQLALFAAMVAQPKRDEAEELRQKQRLCALGAITLLMDQSEV